MILSRVLEYFFRVGDNLTQPNTNLDVGFIKPQEIERTKIHLLKVVQSESFQADSCFGMKKRTREIKQN